MLGIFDPCDKRVFAFFWHLTEVPATASSSPTELVKPFGARLYDDITIRVQNVKMRFPFVDRFAGLRPGDLLG
jgi:hypothetical protein